MSDLRRFSTGAVAALLLGGAFAAPARAGALDPYLPQSGTIDGHIVTFDIAPEDQAISRQFRQAVQNDMEFFKRAVTSIRPGQPLPYDPHMGITQPQYERLLHLKPELRQGAPLTATVKRDADGTISFQPGDDAGKPLGAVTFPPDEAAAITPYGKFTIFNEVHQRDANNPFGTWDGAEWAQAMPADADLPSAKIGFGKHEGDGQGILYLQVAPYKDHQGQSLVVFYKLDRAAAKPE